MQSFRLSRGFRWDYRGVAGDYEARGPSGAVAESRYPLPRGRLPFPGKDTWPLASCLPPFEERCTRLHIQIQRLWPPRSPISFRSECYAVPNVRSQILAPPLQQFAQQFSRGRRESANRGGHPAAELPCELTRGRNRGISDRKRHPLEMLDTLCVSTDPPFRITFPYNRYYVNDGPPPPPRSRERAPGAGRAPLAGGAGEAPGGGRLARGGRRVVRSSLERQPECLQVGVG